MKALVLLLSAAGCLVCALQLSVSQNMPSQYPIADKIADRVIQKYQTSSCEQLQQQKQQPHDAQKQMMEQKAIQQLKNDPQLREHFLNKVAGPIANKLFKCGMIP